MPSSSQLRTCSFLAICAIAASYKLPAAETLLSRRAALAAGLAFPAAALPALAAPSAGLKPCPKGSNNCLSTASTDNTKIATWTWPAAVKRDEALKDLSAVIDGYPQVQQHIFGVLLR